MSQFQWNSSTLEQAYYRDKGVVSMMDSDPLLIADEGGRLDRGAGTQTVYGLLGSMACAGELLQPYGVVKESLS